MVMVVVGYGYVLIVCIGGINVLNIVFVFV